MRFYKWEKKKQTIKNQLESIAKELIELHVKRESTKGHIYSKESELQAMFESDFEYEETTDQKNIINEKNGKSNNIGRNPVLLSLNSQSFYMVGINITRIDITIGMNHESGML